MITAFISASVINIEVVIGEISFLSYFPNIYLHNIFFIANITIYLRYVFNFFGGILSLILLMLFSNILVEVIDLKSWL